MENSWTDWLQDQLDKRQWKQIDLVNYSDGILSASKVSRWLKSKTNPNLNDAIVVANIMGLPKNEALQAAGWGNDVANQVSVKPAPEVRLSEFTTKQLLEEVLSRVESENKFADTHTDVLTQDDYALAAKEQKEPIPTIEDEENYE